jgi:hypothetical protein
MNAATRAALSAGQTEFGLALIATLAVLAMQAIGGFQTLQSYGGDNDSLMRLVEVRDLVAGQGWFDLHQYRLGPDGGLEMHWSRLVDAPIAAIILVATPLAGSVAAAETIAKILWPALLFCFTLFFILRASRLFGGDAAVLPAVVISAPALHFISIFSPGALDHHNVQLLLASAALCLLLEAPTVRPAALLSGVCAALMLAVGMETAPYVAVLGLCVAGLFLFRGAGDGRTARDFGMGFAGVCALAFFATVPASAWSAAQCDAFSVAHFAIGALAGLGLAAAASNEAASRTLGRRLLALGLLGVAVAALAVLAFPQCIADPYSMVDARLRKDWLDHVSEAQPLFTLITANPGMVVARYVTPAIGLAWMVLSLRGRPWRREDVLVGAVLAAAFAVSVWQVRGSNFSIAFAVIPLAAWIAGWRVRARANPSGWVSAKMIVVWVVSLNASWTGAAAAASAAFERKAPGASEDSSPALCQDAQDFAALAALPKEMVLSISNLGSPILASSGHRVLSAPYHRNVEGNTLALDALTGSPDEARAIIERHRVGLVAVCPGNAESKLLAGQAPDGFLAKLMEGSVPAWLEPVAGSAEAPLRLYRVRSLD